MDSNMDEFDASRENIKRRAKQSIIFGICFVLLGYKFYPLHITHLETLGDRLAFTVRWQLPPATFLLISIFVVAVKRALSRAMNPLTGQDHNVVEIHVRVIQNTLEHLVTHVLGQLILTTFLDESTIRIVPVLSVLFCISRILFWVGYLNPEYNYTNRASGVVLAHPVQTIIYGYCWYRFMIDLMS